MKIGFIGTGIMGSPMIKHLHQNGYSLNIYNRTYEKALKLSAYGNVHTSIESLTESSDIILLIVGYPKDVEDVVLEIYKHAKKGTIIVDMTTSSPKLATKLSNIGIEQEIYLLDAPVTGGEPGAIEGTLSTMVGGPKDKFLVIEPLLKTFSKTITYVGTAGFGQYAKLANQIAIAGALAGVVESLYFAMQQNLNLTDVYQILMGGSAQSNQLKVNGLKIMEQNYEPGFFIKHFLKDLNLAIESSHVELKVLNQVKNMLDELVLNGYENKGTQALMLYYLDNLYKTAQK
ncbi:2-hydroxy-3-oxopropionate reductase [Acholeplasma oculi]|uniref:2-hydroxy-3-oxopropionate reductase n=1 Tax=Acholeplasma oculi TaxID=35623 RepID=A0A061AK84_9MOLU|nr:NAD(P)-dependent oxidoreductase [Acholeplasma oculi]CDR31447.1 2-hydroxy-3-oxopropionate reductase [Acholeplasma oculi]SKC40070.1 3-hydroxyisobutyrate dehydrogenase [Acholeplasma oculi]SUT92079.1 2-hydroxy-3-oxopropionate reductase [Acholeplasma oculi]